MDEDDGWWMMDEGRWGGACVRLNCVRIPGCNRGAAAFPTVARSEEGPPRTPQAAAAAAAAAAAGAVLLVDKHLTTFLRRQDLGSLGVIDRTLNSYEKLPKLRNTVTKLKPWLFYTPVSAEVCK